MLTKEIGLKSHGKIAYCWCGHEKIIGRISVQDDEVYFCNNYLGTSYKSDFGYLMMQELFGKFPNIELANRTADGYDTLITGDVLVCRPNSRAIITAVVNDAIFYRYSDKIGIMYASVDELKDSSWELETCDKDAVEIVEFTIEEIAEKLGLDPKVVRIKD